MKTKFKISDFTFRPAGYGCYIVSFTSPTTGRTWHGARVTDMTLIDSTKNADEPTQSDLNALKAFCKQNGRYNP